MILHLALVIGSAAAWAQESPGGRLGRFCNQLNAPAPAEQIRPNSRVSHLMAVVDATQGTRKKMLSAVQRELTYEEWRAEAAKEGLKLSDAFHQPAYRQAARAKCETQLTESATGMMDDETHSLPTEEQYGRRVDDVTGPATSSGSAGTTSEATE